MKVREVLATFKHIFVKRKYKDILFRYVFRDKKEILQLYNAINQTNHTNENDLVITTMEDVIYIGMKNDLSFIIMNEMNLYEHQSTLNENMPLRGFLYFARLYESYIETTIDKLINNNLLNDDQFTKAFINDKLNFTTMGPYRIEQELKKHHIDSNIIYKYLNNIDDEIIDNKINKQITKLMKSSRKKQNLRNKIYTNLLSLGYSNEMILRNINNYDFSN